MSIRRKVADVNKNIITSNDYLNGSECPMKIRAVFVSRMAKIFIRTKDRSM